MRRAILAACIAMMTATASVAAPASALAPGLAGLGFLLGGWSAGKGQVAETGGTSTGASIFTSEVGGAVILRRDHTELADKAGKPMGGFDQIMMIYPEGGAIHADYSDGQHVIHYASAEVQAGKAVTFLTAPQPGAPAFRLAYTLEGADALKVEFAMEPPGATAFRPIATGTLHRAP